MILLIDNYDSFAHNLARYLRRLGQEVKVVRNDAIDVTGVQQLAPEAIVLSPGPCTPNEAGCSLEVVHEFHTSIPLLGVCLGHQTIAAALGASIIRADSPMHGRTSLIKHNHTELFQGIPEEFTVCRYHSLVIEPDSVPESLEVTATTADGTIMAIQHRTLPVFGMQFHPEAILTEYGFELIQNFLISARLQKAPVDRSLFEFEYRSPSLPRQQLPQQPVTF